MIKSVRRYVPLDRPTCRGPVCGIPFSVPSCRLLHSLTEVLWVDIDPLCSTDSVELEGTDEASDGDGKGEASEPGTTEGRLDRR